MPSQQPTSHIRLADILVVLDLRFQPATRIQFLVIYVGLWLLKSVHMPFEHFFFALPAALLEQGGKPGNPHAFFVFREHRSSRQDSVERSEGASVDRGL